MDEIVRCWRSFSITEEEEELVFVDTKELRESESFKCGLLGKLLTK